MTSVSSGTSRKPGFIPLNIFTFNSTNNHPMSRSIANFIDHTLLSPTATESDIERLCREARDFGFKAVCVAGSRLKLAQDLLSGSSVLLAAVVGFPHGNASTEAKACEMADYVKSGADELDVVLNTGWVRSGQLEKVRRELEKLRKSAPDQTLKLILETCNLKDDEKRQVCLMAMETGWDFVKTSTGFGSGGATLADVRLMKEAVGNAMEIKASGGIRDFETALKYLEAGATRIGTSSGPRILEGEKQSRS